MPLWTLAILAGAGFAALATLIIWRIGIRRGVGQVATWAVVGAAGFMAMLFKYSPHVALLTLALGYPAVLLLTGFQPHRLIEADAASKSDDPAARAAANRLIWRFIAGLIVAAVIIFFAVGQPSVRG